MSAGRQFVLSSANPLAIPSLTKLPSPPFTVLFSRTLSRPLSPRAQYPLAVRSPQWFLRGDSRLPTGTASFDCWEICHLQILEQYSSQVILHAFNAL